MSDFSHKAQATSDVLLHLSMASLDALCAHLIACRGIGAITGLLATILYPSLRKTLGGNGVAGTPREWGCVSLYKLIGKDDLWSYGLMGR